VHRTEALIVNFSSRAVKIAEGVGRVERLPANPFVMRVWLDKVTYLNQKFIFASLYKLEKIFVVKTDR
jgi:hypothetical protein